MLYTHFGSGGSGTDSVSRASGTTWAPPPPSRASSPSPLPLSRSRVTTWLSRAALLPGGKEVSTSPGREEGVYVTPREATPRLQPAAGRSCAVQVSALRRLSCGDPRTAQHVPHAARAFGPGAANPPVVLAPPPPGSGSALGCMYRCVLWLTRVQPPRACRRLRGLSAALADNPRAACALETQGQCCHCTLGGSLQTQPPDTGVSGADPPP